MRIIIELKGTATLERIEEFSEILQVPTQNQFSDVFSDVIANIKKEC